MSTGCEEGKTEDDCYMNTYRHIEALMPTLLKEKGWITEHLVQYQGFWLSPVLGLKGVILVQKHFNALPTDLFLATFPKSGTTWFQALIFSIVNRAHFEISTHPLLTTAPHDCIPFIEAMNNEENSISSLNLLPSPRLLATHTPYSLLPDSMRGSGCRIVYVCRNPKDVLVSSWHFMKNLRSKELPPLSLDEAFELFCKGISHFGSFWDHVLGYWNASLQSPKKVLFLHYEDMKKDPVFYTKRLAEFLGCPFSLVEESEGVVQDIIRRCSFDSLSNLEVNKTGVTQFNPRFSVENREFFRKGQIGDWKNYLTPEMEERLDQITEQKFNNSCLMLRGMCSLMVLLAISLYDTQLQPC